MALIPPQIFKREIQRLQTSLTTVVSCPIYKEINVHEIFLSNITPNVDVYVDLAVWLAAESRYIYAFKDKLIPRNRTLNLSGVNLNPGDYIKVKSQNPNTVDCMMSYMERDINPQISVRYPSHFENKGTIATISWQPAYTCPLNNKSTIHDLFICNTTSDPNVSIDVLFKTSTNQDCMILTSILVPANDIIFLDGLNLDSNDKIFVKSTKNNYIHTLVNALETAIL